MTCKINPYWSGIEQGTDYYDTQFYDDATGEPCSYSEYVAGVQGHTNVQIQPNPSGITSNLSWLDKLLATMTSIYAINQKAPYIPTTGSITNTGRNIQQYPQGGYPQYPVGYQGGNAGAQFGGSLQNFVQNNTGLLLIGGAALVLLMMKPPSRRNGIVSDMQKMLGVKNGRRRSRHRRQ